MKPNVYHGGVFHDPSVEESVALSLQKTSQAPEALNTFTQGTTAQLACKIQRYRTCHLKILGVVQSNY